MKILRVLTVMFIMGLLIWGTIPVKCYAIDSSPTTLKINSVSVFENNLELNDMAFAVDYTIIYASPPTETVTDTYNVRLMNGTTEIKNAVPYTFFANGFAKGLVWIYLSAAEVTTHSLTWGGSYVVRLDGNPTAAWTGAIPSAPPYGGIDWSRSSTTLAANSLLLSNYVLAEAQSLQYAWDTTGYELVTTSSAGGSKLTSVGESYFTNVIPNLDVLCPNVLQTASLTKELFTPMATPNKYADSAGSDIQGVSYSTGTATFTHGSNQVTGTDTVWTADMVGGIIKDADEYAYYVIQSINTGTQTITLTSNYVPISSTNSEYSIQYNASVPGTGLPIWSLTQSASALRIPTTIVGFILSFGVLIIIALACIHGTQNAKYLIILEVPGIWLLFKLGWLPIPFVIFLGLICGIFIWWQFFYHPSPQ